ncbi:MAG: tetratricopeptide repeat protein [Candidatus Schekmanbacteria bacterium]|nr:MAG: tetratricopeptide repeat protein [Candidatus Schekmanbacteria bacterium]
MNRNNLIYVSIIIIFAFVSYCSSLNYGFTNWDVPSLILENKRIQTFDLSMLKNIFTKPTGYDYLPLKELSYAIDYKIWQKNAYGYHLTNLILYLLMLIVVYYFSLLITGERTVSFFGLFLFALHPVHIEPVCWIAGRKDLLSGIFIFLSLHLFLKYFIEKDKKNSFLFYLLSLFFTILALMSKPISVLIPFYLVLLLFFKIGLSESDKKYPYKAIIPHFLLSIFAALLTVIVGIEKTTVKEWTMAKSIEAVVNYPLLLFWYAKKLFFPFNLSPLYDEADYSTLPPLSRILLFILFVAILCIILKKCDNFSKFFTSLFVVSFLPVSGVVPISISKADRYLFIPSFVLLCAAKFLFEYGEKEESVFSYKIDRNRKILSASIFFISLLFLLLSVKHSSIWRNSHSLWEYAASRYPEVSAIRNNLGNVYFEEGKFAKAKLEFLRAISLDEKNWKAHSNLGEIFKKEGNIDMAIKEFEKALSINDRNEVILTSLGNIYRKKGLVRESERLLRDALAYNEDYFPAYAGLAGTLVAQRRYDEAKKILKEAVRRGIADRRVDFMLNIIERESAKGDVIKK